MSTSIILEDEVRPRAPEAERAPHIIAIANQKGGVGKTTTAINLATAIAADHQNVLLVDIDAQGNACTALGVDKNIDRPTTYDVLLGEAALAEAIVETDVPRLSLLPASMNLAGAEMDLLEMPRREYRLADAFEGLGFRFDYVLIDCPPTLGLLTLNALCAADGVMVPVQCEFLALEGLTHLVRTIERVRRNLNLDLEIEGIVLTMFDQRNNQCKAIAADVRAHFGDKVFEAVIPRNVRVSEAPSHGKPVLLYDWRCAGSTAYIHLAGEILRRDRERVG